MRVLIWCLRATGTVMMVLAYFMVFSMDMDNFRSKVTGGLTLMFWIGGFLLYDKGERLRKGSIALNAMRE